MANWNDRRGHRGHGHDAPREDIHQGPWSPYNGRPRDDERETWGARGREYWLEDDRWEDRRMGMGDQWRQRDDGQDQEENDALWGNRMGLREEPSERSIPRAGAWQREPRYGEMERMWSDRDDHPWPDERRATDEERREHRDYAHPRHAPRDGRDDYARERGGEQYPHHARQGWRDEEPRNWTERRDRDNGEPPRSRQSQRLREGRDEQRILDEERFGHAPPEWAQRTYQRGFDDRGDDRAMRGRDDRDMRGREMHGRDDRDMRGREMRGRDDRDMRSHDMRAREMHDRGMRGRDDRGTYDRDMRGRDDRDTRGRDDRDLDQRRGEARGDDRSGARFGGQRRDRNRYD